ncbi:hypothetical protein QTP81_00185 [Alteromonas sp. ASW11-36]|uniref:Transporter substrate-binding domain-containing protein n=1 Tax=Alteromonas arenosi TaxID=3055817 RepID=A0ABT7SS51_9ALTE|nr:hypothetical protein [Alteromonas sp. ASW11-36]MDM7859018.1 hypothetical protein [Alteromonas sp. ASW11-36]
MKIKFTLCGFWLIYLGLGSFVYASERYTIAVSEIANTLTKPPAPPGRYNRFLATLDNIDLVFMPPGRVEVEFTKDYLNCIFPASTETMSNRHQLLESYPLEVTYAYIFTRDEQTFAALNAGSNIAIRRGFTYGGVRQTLPARYVELDDDETVLQFLHLGRVDAIISYLVDTQGAAESLQLPVPHFQQDTPIHTARETFVCQKSTQNQAFIRQVNDSIKQWLKSTD